MQAMALAQKAIGEKVQSARRILSPNLALSLKVQNAKHVWGNYGNYCRLNLVLRYLKMSSLLNIET